VLLKDHICRFDGNAPSRCNQGIAMLHSRGSIPVVPGTSSGVLNHPERR
jgi:hypothetical protein